MYAMVEFLPGIVDIYTLSGLKSGLGVVVSFGVSPEF